MAMKIMLASGSVMAKISMAKHHRLNNASWRNHQVMR